MSETITLLCWVVGTPTKRIFPVEVGHDEIWGSVKDVIKEEMAPEFDDIDADTLDLRKVCHCAVRYAQLPIKNLKGHHWSFPMFPLGIRRFLE